MEASLRRLTAFFKNDRLRDLDDTRLLQYRDHQLAPGSKTPTEGYQPATVKLDLSFLSRGLKIAFGKRLLRELPIMPKVRRRKRTAMIRPDEMETLLSGMPEHWRRFFRIVEELGWRARSELRTRKWPDVSFEQGFVHLDAESSKTHEARVFPMTKRLRALLEDQRQWVSLIEQRTGQIIPWVCPREDGKQLGEYKKVWRTACAKAGWGKVEGRTGPWSSVKVAHDIRRTAQNRLEEMGIRAGVRQAIAGHSSASTFQAYYEVASLEDLKRAAERIDAFREAEEPSNVVSITKKP
jgi:integrase